MLVLFTHFRTILSQQWLLHPILLALFFVLYGYNEMADSIAIIDFIVTLLYFVVTVTLFTAIICYKTINFIRFGVWFTCWLIYFFYTKNFIYYFKLYPYKLFIIFALGLFLVIFCWFTRKKKLYQLNLILNIVTLLYCFIEIPKVISNAQEQHKLQTQALKAEKPKEICANCPDIYLIVLDAYAATESLKTYLNFDNHIFLDTMRKLDFHDIQYAQTNYRKTLYSIATLLQMDYIADEKNLTAHNRQMEKDLYQKIKYNPVLSILGNKGYKSYNLSFFKLQNTPSYAGYETAIFTSSYLPIFLLKKTLLFRMVSIMFPFNKEKRLLQPLKILKSLHQKPHKTPQFVYLHLLCPHTPVEFDKQGNLFTDEQLQQTNNFQRYVEQLQYLNSLIINLAAEMDKTATKPYLMLITGDHGARISEKEPIKTIEGQSTTTLFRFPDKNYEILYDSMSTVNLFRAVLHKAVGQPLVYLPDTLVREAEKVNDTEN